MRQKRLPRCQKLVLRAVMSQRPEEEEEEADSYTSKLCPTPSNSQVFFSLLCRGEKGGGGGALSHPPSLPPQQGYK